MYKCFREREKSFVFSTDQGGAWSPSRIAPRKHKTLLLQYLTRFLCALFWSLHIQNLGKRSIYLVKKLDFPKRRIFPSSYQSSSGSYLFSTSSWIQLPSHNQLSRWLSRYSLLVLRCVPLFAPQHVQSFLLELDVQCQQKSRFEMH